ncbi:hypothetical protein GQ457_02G040490 [Hibiscus cannabinus]
MTTNKERIENLETALGTVQDQLSKLETSISAKLQQMETSLSKTTDALLSKQEPISSHANSSIGRSQHAKEESRGSGRSFSFSHPTKLEFPRYAGDDPTEWFTRIDQLFEFHGTMDFEKVHLASFHLEGEANQWWRWMRRSYMSDDKEITWELFVEELWARFGPTDCEDFHEALSKIKQVGTLRDYQKEFERLGNRVQGWSQQALVGTFLGGLKVEIADGIRMFKPKTLEDVISLAKMRDDQLMRQRKFQRPSNVINQSSSLPTSKPAPSMKRLTWSEMQQRRAQGLCFNCDEKFTTGHKCRGPQFLLLEGHEIRYEEEAMGDILEHQPEISLHALSGWSSYKTMRVLATIGAHTTVVLIDSGSTHNFISNKMATMLQLPVIPTKSFNVKVANGEPLQCHGRFENVPIHLQGIPFVLTLYALPLSGLDLVLGIHWLEQLGTVVCNWKQLTMEFQWNNETHKLQGLHTTTIQPATMKVITKEARHGGSMFAIALQSTIDLNASPINPEMRNLLDQFEDIFHEPSQLPPRRDIAHHINLQEGTDPINVRPYRYAHFQKAEIEKQVHDMLKSGLIRPSTSPFSSPVLLVKKKDGSWRFCTDYRALSAVTIKDRFPIPTVDDMLDELYGATYFTKIDLRAGYLQVRVHEPDIHKTAFRTHNGHFEYLVMPFGLCNAPSTFQAIMNFIFRPYLRKFILVFFDDILIYSLDWNMHLEHVKIAFEILRQHCFFIKFSKCAFGLHELEYLGHIITPQGVKVDQAKIQTMLNWPTPTNVSELRGFLGITGYYRKFVRNYGIIAKPLTNLLKKGKFAWHTEAEGAFQELKNVMTSTPTLAMPNFNEPFVIEADASGTGIGAILSQQGRPIAFMSRALGISKLSLSVYEKEMLAIIHAIRIWRPYLMGSKFYIETDQRSLKYLLDQRIGTLEQQKWVSKLMGYDYEIRYRPGRTNNAADALSRVAGSPSLHSLFVSHTQLWDLIRKDADDSPYMRKIRQLASNDPSICTELPHITDDGQLVLEPEAILDTRWIHKGSKFVEESLIKWKRLPVEDATWENTKDLKDKFLNLHLEDKVSVQGVAFQELEILTVADCVSLEEVFQLHVHASKNNVVSSQLREVNLIRLPKLKHVWNKDPNGSVSFEDVRKVVVRKCWSLKTIFPFSIAKRLLQLERLTVENCGVEQIVSKIDGGVEHEIQFEFNQLSVLELWNLPNLICFYPGTHKTLWPALKKLRAYRCGKIKIFGHVQSRSQSPEPILIIEQVIPQLELVSFDVGDIAMINDHQFDADMFCNIRHLDISFNANETNDFPVCFLKRFYNLKRFEVGPCHFKESSPSEGDAGEEKDMNTTLPRIKKLRLDSVSNTRLLWTQEGRMSASLESLQVWQCHSLINLGSYFSTLQNLTTLDVWNCKEMTELITSCKAQSLVCLVTMKIRECGMMREVVASQGDETTEEIVFKKLKCLELDCLVSLKSFCSVNHTFRFPFLEQVILSQCPRMNNFCQGVLSTPKLNKVRLTKTDFKGHWAGDLNVTVDQLYKEQVGYRDLKHLKLSEFSELVDVWSRNPQEMLDLKSVKFLEVCDLDNLRCIFNLSVAVSLGRLQQLEIKRCNHLEQVIKEEDLDTVAGEAKITYGNKIITIFPLLRSVHCVGVVFEHDKLLPGKNGEDEAIICDDTFFSEKVAFPNLQELKVSLLTNVKRIWYNQLRADSFSKLKKLTVECCDALLNIFPYLELQEFQSLEILTIIDCASLEQVFQLQVYGSDIISSQLREVNLIFLPKLKHVWNKDPNGSLSFGNLRKAFVWECWSLKTLFPFSIAKDLLQLESLIVENCGVEQIVSKNFEGVEQEIRFEFNQLSFVRLSNLPKLECFFPGTHRTVLPVLKRLSTYCCEKTEIFGHAVSVEKGKSILPPVVHNYTRRPILPLGPKAVRWCPPSFPLLKLNVDGAFRIEDRCGAIGFIVRDNVGLVLGGGAYFIREAHSADFVEAQAVIHALWFACSKGIKKVIIECDAPMVASKLKNKFADFSMLGLILEETKQLMNSFEDVQVRCVNRICGAVGFIVRDNVGSVLGGGAYFIREAHSTDFVAAQAVIHALWFACSKGFKKVILECDAPAVASKLKNKFPDFSMIGLILEEAKQLMNSFEDVQVRHDAVVTVEETVMTEMTVMTETTPMTEMTETTPMTEMTTVMTEETVMTEAETAATAATAATVEPLKSVDGEQAAVHNIHALSFDARVGRFDGSHSNDCSIQGVERDTDGRRFDIDRYYGCLASEKTHNSQAWCYDGGCLALDMVRNSQTQRFDGGCLALKVARDYQIRRFDGHRVIDLVVAAVAPDHRGLDNPP